MRHALIALFAAATLFSGVSFAQGFKFSNEDTSDQQREAETQTRVQAILASPCRSKIKNQKVMVLIGESHNGYVKANQSAYGGPFDALNARLQRVVLFIRARAHLLAAAAIDDGDILCAEQF